MKTSGSLFFFLLIGCITFWSFSVFGYQADKDITFNVENRFNGLINSLTIQSDEKVIVGGFFTSYSGTFTNYVIRLNTDGSRDSSFNIGSGFNNYINSVVVQSDGKILVGGVFSNYNGTAVNNIVRLNTDGSRDSSFNIGSGFNNYINSVAIQSDGKILVGGVFSNYNGTAVNRIIRLNTDGSRDSSFNIGGGFTGVNGYVNSLAIQSDGKILVGGNFTGYNGTIANRIIRLNTDGSRDSSFNIGGGLDGDIFALMIRAYSILVQPDGKILVGGQFSRYNGINNNNIVRLNTDGSRDSSFSIGSGFDNNVRSLFIQSDGKILVGGSFTNYNGNISNNIIRLNTDGSRDSSFNVGSGFNNYINSVVVQPSGKIFIGGTFTNYKGQLAGYLIALKGDGAVPLQNSSNFNDTLPYFTYRGYSFSGSFLSGYERISLKNTNGLIPTTLNLNNQNNKLMLPINLGFKKADNITNYTGEIYPPTTYSVSNVDNKPILSAISVGSPSESLTLTNGAATLGIPTPTSSIGDPVSIYSSQNGVDWIFEKGGIVSEIDGQSYVSFTTNHFTYFAIAGSTGSFVINNDEASTLSQSVNLTISAPTATGMKFSNNGITWSDWEPISNTKSWVLSEGYSEKTISAQFIANGDIYTTSDSILYTDGTPGNGTSGNGTQGNISLTITGGITECVYGTSLAMDAQEVKIGIPYTFTGTFPSAWYCQDYRGITSEWTLTIQTTDLTNEKSNVISGGNLLISHDPVVVEGDSSCTGDNGTATQFYNAPYVLFAKASGSNKICKVSADNVSLLVNVPANQAPGNYSGTLTLTMNGF